MLEHKCKKWLGAGNTALTDLLSCKLDMITVFWQYIIAALKTLETTCKSKWKFQIFQIFHDSFTVSRNFNEFKTGLELEIWNLGCQLLHRMSSAARVPVSLRNLKICRCQRWCSEFQRVPGTRGTRANSSPAKYHPTFKCFFIRLYVYFSHFFWCYNFSYRWGEP